MGTATHEWVRVSNAGWWAPTEEGEAIEGVFCGIAQIPGEHGSFDAARVRRADGGLVAVSGVHLLRQIDDAAIAPGDRVRVVYEGTQPVRRREGAPMRVFALFVEAKRNSADGGAP